MRAFLPRLLIVALFALPADAAALRHVRVVLDLSQSMRQNDSGHMALLSTILLRDLVRPNPTLGESFEVIPFDRDWKWAPHGTPPVSTQPRIKAEMGRRAEFVNAISALPYDARMTYFYPGLLAALQDLQQVRGGAADTRTIVLVTDGVPEQATRDEELQRIQSELGPRLEKNNIRLYVLAFGREADQNRPFFEAIVHSPGGTPLGEFFVDPNGSRLLDYMLQIFARSFGFSPDTAHALPGTTAVDLEKHNTPKRVAVTVFSPNPQPPQLRLAPPAGGIVNDPEGVESAGVSGGSYSIEWVLQPNPGDYALATDAASGSVAMLRPTDVKIEIEPMPPHKQAERTIAGTPLPMRVIVSPANGAIGDPGEVELSFRTVGERTNQAATGTPGYAWEGEIASPASNAGTAGPRGRVYEIVAEFREDPENPTKMYAGYIEITARRGEAIVGSLTGQHAHRVEVHPHLSIAPLPLSAYASSNALERGQRACTQFTFNINGGQLPHPGSAKYPIRAMLVASDPAALDHELRRTSFDLDGLPLQFDGQSVPQSGEWFKGRLLSQTELLSPHNLCVHLGRPTQGDPSKPLELTLVTTLVEVPYDDFKIIQPFGLKMLIAQPTLFDKWRIAVVTGAALLLLFALLWYLRDRPELPPDLGYAIGRDGANAPLMPRALEERSGLAKLLGRLGESRVTAPGEDATLGNVRPVRDALFKLRIARGVRVEPVGHEAITMQRRLATLSVQRLYRLQSKHGTYLFRLEYR